MATVYVRNRTRVAVDLEQMRDFARRILEGTREWRSAELSVTLVGDRAIQALNERWRGKPRPTDVLSFPMEDEPEPGEALLLGDIVIAPRQAVQDAREEGVTPDAKMRELILHSILHLTGCDHETPEGARRMEKRKRLLLDRLERNK